MSTCHHHVDNGDCPACDSSAGFRIPSPDIKYLPLHLKGLNGPLCEADVGPTVHYSTLEEDDTGRFCKLCLLVLRAQLRKDTEARLAPYRRHLQIGAFVVLAALILTITLTVGWVFVIPAVIVYGLVVWKLTSLG
jgi:hypothetical protein